MTEPINESKVEGTIKKIILTQISEIRDDIQKMHNDYKQLAGRVTGLEKRFSAHHQQSEENQKHPTSSPQANQVAEQIQTVQQTFAIQGLKFTPVPGDSHCLFHAVAQQLTQQDEPELQHGDTPPVKLANARMLRRKVAQHINEYKAEFTKYFTEDETLVSHVTAIQLNKWGDQPDIRALQQIYNRPIIVIRSDYVERIDSNIGDAEPIFIFHNGVNHYDALDLEDGFTAKGIISEIQRQQAAKSKVVYLPSSTPSDKPCDGQSIAKNASSFFAETDSSSDNHLPISSNLEVKSGGR